MARVGPRKRPPTRDMTIRQVEPFPGLMAIHVGDIRNLYYTFGRIQEAWENPEFKGRTDFDYKDLQYHYKDKLDVWPWQIWSSYHLPLEAFKPFFSSDIKPNNDGERRVLYAIKQNMPKYVIGFVTEDYISYKRGIRHAMYHLNPKYRKTISKLLAKWKEEEPLQYEELESFLKSLKYPDTVMEEEMHIHLQEPPWPDRMKLRNAFLNRFRNAFIRGIKQLNSSGVDEFLDLAGTRRLRRVVKKAVVQGSKKKFKEEGVKDGKGITKVRVLR